MSERNMTVEDIRVFNAKSEGYNLRAEEINKTLDGEAVSDDQELNAIVTTINGKRVEIVINVQEALVEVTTEPVVISEDDKPDTPVEDTVEEEQLPAVESGRDVQASEDNGVRGVSTDGSTGPKDPVSTRDVLPEREVLPLKDSGLGQRDDDATGLPRESGSDRKRQAPGTPGRVEDSAT